MANQFLMDFIEPPIVYVTTDYDKFKIISYNRKLRHMCKFSKVVGKCNKLYVHPIIVSKKMEVIDGQHRLEYAKEGGYPIYYIIDHNFHPSDLINHNITASNWVAMDYGKFYSSCNSEEITSQQRKDYQFFVNVCKEYKIAFDIFMKMFHKHKGGGSASMNFKNGDLHLRYTYDQIIQYVIAMDNIIKYLKKNKIILNSSIHVYMALFRIIRLDGYEDERMFKKMEENLDGVLLAFKFRKYDEIAIRLLEVYNKHAKQKIELHSKSDI